MPNIVHITLLSSLAIGLSLATFVQTVPVVQTSNYDHHHHHQQQQADLLPVLAQIHTYSAASPRVSAISGRQGSHFWNYQKKALWNSLSALSDLASGASALSSGSSSGGSSSGGGGSLLSSALSSGNSNKDPDDEGGLLSSSSSSSSSSSKPIPYKFTSAEMTAIQAMVSLRDIIGELLQKVGFNIPGIASIITRSEGADKSSGSDSSLSTFGGSSTTSTKSTNVGVQVLRGLALLSPLIIPMATQIRRMSPDYSLSGNSFGASGISALPSLPSSLVQSPVAMQMPMPMISSFPDIYYNQAMHRRRGKRSTALQGRQQISGVHLQQFQQHPLLSSPSLLRYLARLQQQAQHKWK